MNHSIHIRPGRIEDRDFAEQMFCFARRSLHAAGIDQWQGDYPSADDFLRDVAHGIAVVMEADAKPVGIATVYIGTEPTYAVMEEGAWRTNQSRYGMIHRIAIHPDAQKSGIATAVIEYLARQCAEAGIVSMRCDTHKDNLPMRRTLEKNGYTLCGTIHVEDGTPRVAYERCL